MEPIIEQILTPALVASTVVWFLKDWISSRLKSSIQHEYDQKMQILKTALDAQNSANLEILRNDLILKTKLIEIEKTWIHQRTAEALLILHKGTNSLLKIVRSYVVITQGPEYNNPENIVPVKQELDDFLEIFEKTRILIPDSLVELVELFVTNLEHQVARFKYEVASVDQSSYETHTTWLDIDRIVIEDSKVLLRNLEKEFKRTIGVHNPEASAAGLVPTNAAGPLPNNRL